MRGCGRCRLGDQGQLATVTLRGSSTDQVLVLLDGIPLTSAAGGTVDLSTIPQGLIDHIDVLRGDAAARYGALPWRMGLAAYEEALAAGGTEPLRGPAAESPWEPPLAVRMAQAGRAVMEERLIPVLLRDLSGTGGAAG